MTRLSFLLLVAISLTFLAIAINAKNEIPVNFFPNLETTDSETTEANQFELSKRTYSTGAKAGAKAAPAKTSTSAKGGVKAAPAKTSAKGGVKAAPAKTSAKGGVKAAPAKTSVQGKAPAAKAGAWGGNTAASKTAGKTSTTKSSGNWPVVAPNKAAVSKTSFDKAGSKSTLNKNQNVQIQKNINGASKTTNSVNKNIQVNKNTNTNNNNNKNINVNKNTNTNNNNNKNVNINKNTNTGSKTTNNKNININKNTNTNNNNNQNKDNKNIQINNQFNDNNFKNTFQETNTNTQNTQNTNVNNNNNNGATTLFNGNNQNTNTEVIFVNGNIDVNSNIVKEFLQILNLNNLDVETITKIINIETIKTILQSQETLNNFITSTQGQELIKINNNQGLITNDKVNNIFHFVETGSVTQTTITQTTEENIEVIAVGEDQGEQIQVFEDIPEEGLPEDDTPAPELGQEAA